MFISRWRSFWHTISQAFRISSSTLLRDSFARLLTCPRRPPFSRMPVSLWRAVSRARYFVSFCLYAALSFFGLTSFWCGRIRGFLSIAGDIFVQPHASEFGARYFPSAFFWIHAVFFSFLWLDVFRGFFRMILFVALRLIFLWLFFLAGRFFDFAYLRVCAILPVFFYWIE